MLVLVSVSARLSCLMLQNIIFFEKCVLNVQLFANKNNPPFTSRCVCHLPLQTALQNEPPCQVRNEQWLASLAQSQLTKQQRLLNLTRGVLCFPARGFI